MTLPSMKMNGMPLALVAGSLAAHAPLAAQTLASRLIFNTVTPCRIVDTRLAAAAALQAGEVRSFHVVGSAGDFAGQGGAAGGCDIPGFTGAEAQVQAVAFNVVAVRADGPGNLRGWPSDGAPSSTSILNYGKVAGLNLANEITLALRQDTEGHDLRIRADGSGTHLVVDVMGYYQRVTQADGSGSGIDADALDGLDAAAFAAAGHHHGQAYWRVDGNAGMPPGSFLGTTADAPIEIRVNGQVAARLEPGRVIPNAILGHANTAEPGSSGVAIGGGTLNHVADDFTYVGGGSENRATDLHAAVLGGLGNQATGDYAVVGGGRENEAVGYGATTVGGSLNHAVGAASTVVGGHANSAFGENSLAGGTRAVAAHHGAFVWADAQSRDELASTGDHQFVVRARGGLWLGEAGPVSIPAGVFLNTSSGAHLTRGGAWTNASDAALKEGFEPVDRAAVLDAVARLPLASWSYRTEGGGVRHVGPTAQDFHAAFGLGADDRSITTVDAAGIALAAIQELERRTREVAALAGEVRELRALLEGVRGDEEPRSGSSLVARRGCAPTSGQ